MSDSLQHILDMVWTALGQSEKSSIAVDEKTFSFFTQSPPQPKKTKKEGISSSQKPSSAQAHIMPYAVSEDKQEARVAIKEKISSPTEVDRPSQTSNEKNTSQRGDQSQIEQRRLTKLLPRPVSLTQKEISKKELDDAKKYLTISEQSLYTDTKQSKKKAWAIFIELNQNSPHERFIQSVLSAISSRLEIQVHTYSCKESPLAIHLPLLVQECDHLLIVVDQHIESTIKKSVETISSFSPSQNISPIPFSTFGTVHGRPIHGLTLHVHSHEESSFKQQLWGALQRLAHTSYT